MIGDLIGEWIKGILIDGIMGNLSGLFNTVNVLRDQRQDRQHDYA